MLLVLAAVGLWLLKRPQHRREYITLKYGARSLPEINGSARRCVSTNTFLARHPSVVIRITCKNNKIRFAKLARKRIVHCMP